MIDLIRIDGKTGCIHRIQLQMAVVHCYIEEFVLIGGIFREPVPSREIHGSSATTVGVIDDASIINGFARRASQDGAGPFIIMVMPIEDYIDSVGLEKRYKVFLYFPIATAAS